MTEGVAGNVSIARLEKWIDQMGLEGKTNRKDMEAENSKWGKNREHE